MITSPCKIQYSLPEPESAANLSRSALVVSPFVLVQEFVLEVQSALAGPSVYLTVMSSSNTPESGAVSEIGPSSLVPLSIPPSTTEVPMVITPFCAVSPPAVASVTESEPLAT